MILTTWLIKVTFFGVWNTVALILGALAVAILSLPILFYWMVLVEPTRLLTNKYPRDPRSFR